MSEKITRQPLGTAYITAKTLVFTAIILLCFCARSAKAQGGWAVWDIHLKDGKTLFASPLISANEKFVIYGVGSKYHHKNSIKGLFQIKRAKIDYIEIATEDGKPKILLSGVFENDLVVLRDGQKISGRITEISSKNLWETTLLIDGRNVDLSNIAVIKFGATKKIGNSKRNPNRC